MFADKLLRESVPSNKMNYKQVLAQIVNSEELIHFFLPLTFRILLSMNQHSLGTRHIHVL